MTDHPYRNLPSHCFWRQAHNVNSIDEVDPVVAVPFRIDPSESVATAGSCFAQHIARHLSASGYNYMVTEEAHPLLPPEVARQHNYGIFTARYGNLYTARQLLQLFKRAYGLFKPADDMWVNEDDRFLDPYRPTIEPKGFGSRREFELDRERHFAAIRAAFEQMDVFIFTFGLTEAYVSLEDGAVYPICPGVAGGRFDPQKHVFKNFTAQEVTADFLEFIDLVRAGNPRVRFIITVSPVPLVATGEATKSVISATVYSKSVLRIACEEISKSRPDVAYFPSFEIVTGNYTRGQYFADDLRSVTEAGVAHVMKIFMKHFAVPPNEGRGFFGKLRRRSAAVAEVETLKEVERALDLICEEELLGEGLPQSEPR